MRRAAPPALALAAAVLLAACGDDGPSEGLGERPAAPAVTTRVEVVEALGEGVRFDPRAIYRREAAGVATVFSVFDDGRQGVGSGFVLSADGEVLTNAHVVSQGEGSSIAAAAEVFVQLADRNQLEAEVVGRDLDSDLALLRIDPAGLTLRPLPLGRSDHVDVGDPVAAIGSPYGEPQSLSVGVVSARDRSIESLTGFVIPGALQTDAAINRGNSGGPLVDARGRVVGVNAQIRSTGGGGEGVGFAIGVDTVRRVVEDLRDDGSVDYAFLGVQTAALYPQLAERFGLGTVAGAWVQELEEDGPAARAGVRAGDGDGAQRFQSQDYRTGGDVIVAVQGAPVREPDDLNEQLARFAPGRRVRLDVVRDGARRTFDVRLGRRPEAGG